MDLLTRCAKQSHGTWLVHAVLRPTAQEKTSCSLVGLVGLQGKMPPPELIHTSGKQNISHEIKAV